MSELIESGGTVIRGAEEELRKLLGRAAGTGDYESILVLTEWAKNLRGLLEDGEDGNARRPTAGKSPGQQTGPGAEARRAAPLHSGGEKAPGRATSVRGKKRAGRLKKRPSSSHLEYPKFLRDGDSLVKIGWSRSEKAPYEHKAPYSVLALLIEALERAGRHGGRFTMDDILPLKEQKDGTEIPTYQVYVCLAWLRAEELIVQHGRQGYSLPSPAKISGVADEKLEKLPKR